MLDFNEVHLCRRTGKPCVGYSNWCLDCSRFFDVHPGPVSEPVTQRVRSGRYLIDRRPQSNDDGEGDCG